MRGWAAVVLLCIGSTGCKRAGFDDGAGEAYLSLRRIPTPFAIDLTHEGELDWAQWGMTIASDFNHKAGVRPQISNYERLGSGPEAQLLAFTGLPLAWSDGTPTPAASDVAGGIIIDTAEPAGDGYRLTVSADTTPKILQLFVGNWCTRFAVTASLSDDSVDPAADDSWVIFEPRSETSGYQIDFRAASENQALFVDLVIETNNCTIDDLGEIWLMAATLRPGH